MIIDKNKESVLQENWQQYLASGYDCSMSLAEYVRREAESDSGFFRWLFDNENLSDFECPDEVEFEYMISNMEERPVV